MPPQNAPRILIIRRRYLGDVVLLGALLRNLRLHWPGAVLAVLVEPGFAEALSLNTDVDQVIPTPAGVRAFPGFMRAVRNARFTHVLDLDNTEQTALVARLSGADVRVGLHHGSLRLKLPFAYTHRVHDPADRHETSPLSEYYLRALDPLGVPVASRDIRLEPHEADVLALRRFVGASSRVLLVHPGSRSPSRLWPAERFATVIDHAQDELDAQVILTGGPADAAILDAIRQRVRTHLLNPPGPASLFQFAALARLSDAVLCHDSGPMHVAAAVGTPVIALYGSQNVMLFRPAGPRHTVLQPPLPCTSCVAPQECDPSDSYRSQCVRNISVDRVIDAVTATLAAARMPSPTSTAAP